MNTHVLRREKNVLLTAVGKTFEDFCSRHAAEGRECHWGEDSAFLFNPHPNTGRQALIRLRLHDPRPVKALARQVADLGTDGFVGREEDVEQEWKQLLQRLGQQEALAMIELYAHDPAVPDPYMPKFRSVSPFPLQPGHGRLSLLLALVVVEQLSRQDIYFGDQAEMKKYAEFLLLQYELIELYQKLKTA